MLFVAWRIRRYRWRRYGAEILDKRKAKKRKREEDAAREAAAKANREQRQIELDERKADWAERLAALAAEEEEAIAAAANRVSRHAAIVDADERAALENADRKQRRKQLIYDEERGCTEGVARIQARPGLLKQLKEEEQAAVKAAADRRHRRVQLDAEMKEEEMKNGVANEEAEEEQAIAKEEEEDGRNLSKIYVHDVARNRESLQAELGIELPEENVAAARFVKSHTQASALLALNAERERETAAVELIQARARARAAVRDRKQSEQMDVIKMMSRAFFMGNDTKDDADKFTRTRRNKPAPTGAPGSPEMQAALVRIRELETGTGSLQEQLAEMTSARDAALIKMFEMQTAVSQTKERLDALEAAEAKRREALVTRMQVHSLLQKREARGAKPTSVEASAALVLQAGMRGCLGRRKATEAARVAEVTEELGLSVKPYNVKLGEDAYGTLPKDIETIAANVSLLTRLELLANKRRKSIGSGSTRAPATKNQILSEREAFRSAGGTQRV